MLLALYCPPKAYGEARQFLITGPRLRYVASIPPGDAGRYRTPRRKVVCPRLSIEQPLLSSSMSTVSFFTSQFFCRAVKALASMTLPMGWSIGCGGFAQAASVDAGDEAKGDVSQTMVDGGEVTPASRDGAGAADVPAFCSIERSNYNKSCSSDSDCVRVADNIPVDFGDYCQWLCRCGGDAINQSSVAQYVADVSRTPLGSGTVGGPAMGCSCGFAGPACCLQGQCTAGTGCLGTTDSGVTDVMSDASGYSACFSATGQLSAALKSCQADGDCVTKVEFTDCCGSILYVGVSAVSAGRFDLCENAWQAHFLGPCACPPGEPMSEDGTTITGASASSPQVHCASGACMTFVPDSSAGDGSANGVSDATAE